MPWPASWGREDISSSAEPSPSSKNSPGWPSSNSGRPAVEEVVWRGSHMLSRGASKNASR